ncbi:cupin domain-containing protein [Consotaella salsifontis]|uniref:Cupin domain-containing protein n=1 Tax=Consotaella salsifontis TaxID=1365950 RepID=A0A1T4MMR4_9HYPH|nr:hypothetical protein [Consotaella salsifontis]SJZ68161.1 hypothetical protein SAMN05428963_102187 [Consotaella salsifontis]
MKASLADLLSQISAQHGSPAKQAIAQGFAHGTMSLSLYTPRQGERQEARDQDAVFIIASGSAEIDLDCASMSVKMGDAVFARAGKEHRFSDMSEDFAAWVMLWGPTGGEAPAISPSVFAAIDA